MINLHPGCSSNRESLKISNLSFLQGGLNYTPPNCTQRAYCSRPLRCYSCKHNCPAGGVFKSILTFFSCYMCFHVMCRVLLLVFRVTDLCNPEEQPSMTSDTAPRSSSDSAQANCNTGNMNSRLTRTPSSLSLPDLRPYPVPRGCPIPNRVFVGGIAYNVSKVFRMVCSIGAELPPKTASCMQE